MRTVTPYGFFRSLLPADREQLLACSFRQRFQRGAVLFSQDDTVDRLFIVASGFVGEGHCTIDGREVILFLAGPGDMVGSPVLLDDSPSLTTATALEDIEALVAPGERLRELLVGSPTLTRALLAGVAKRLRASEVRRVEAATCEATVRVGRRILELVYRWGASSVDGIELDLSLSQEELAAMAAVSREAAVKALRELRDLGLITTRRRRITVVDIAGLEQRADVRTVDLGPDTQRPRETYRRFAPVA